MSKGNSNLGLVVKTLVQDHNCYRTFSNPRVSAAFLAQHYKTRIIGNHAYKIKDMKKDAEEKLRVNVGYSKCKRARRMVLDAYTRAFTIEFSEFQAFADELLRSNASSTVNVEICRDDLKEGRRIFICLNACKKGWKADCRPIIGLDGCFLKTKFKGELLVALGKMRMNKIFL